jgi:hypothetical protein
MQANPLPAHAHPGTNVPAIVRGWEKEGRARVELLAPAEGLPIGSEFVVGLRPDPKHRTPIDFAFLNKQGLRVGGIVLLRRLRASEEGMSARAIEILKLKESDGASFVIQDAASCILPPLPGTAMVSEALVTMLSSAISARTLTEAIAKMVGNLDQPSLFGLPGLAYHGRTKAGEAVEVIVGGDAPMKGDELIARLLRECPKDVIKESRTSGTNREPWRLVPFFRAPIDPDRSSRMSALAANLAYGSAATPCWTPGIVVLRTISDHWSICDATPADDASARAQPLIELKA